jgi:KDO2-lipid IV(A) lauroyltransferase
MPGPSYFAYRGGAAIAQGLPPKIAEPLAAATGTVLATVVRGRRRMLERHLRRVLGDGAPVGPTARQAFRSYARYWLEAFRLPAEPRERIDGLFSIDGLDHIDAALAAGSGAIIALPHLGGWDWGGAWLGLRGYPMTVVVEPLEPPELFEWFASWRRSIGLEIVPLGPDAATAVLRALNANHIVGLLCDRDLTGDGCEVEFFGERTTLPGGPATLAFRRGAPLLPAAVYFEPSGRHHAVVQPALPVVREGRLRDDIARVTQDIARALESLIRAAPEQWHLMQPNWPSDRAGSS